MNVIKENIDELHALLIVQIEKNDCADGVKKALNGYRKKTEVKGFRVGMAPMALIQKMYGRLALIDEVNSLVYENLETYINNEKLKILGEPIPCSEKQKDIHWDMDTDFEFVFEIGLSPDFDITIDSNLSIPYYNITIGEGMIKSHVKYIRDQYGKRIKIEEVVDGADIQVDLSQENAIQVQSTFVWLSSIQDEKQKNLFLKKKIGDSFEINVNELYSEDNERAYFLNLDKEELVNINPIYTLTIKSISILQKAEINQELFDRAFGKDNIKSEAEFIKKVEEDIAKTYDEQSNSRFGIDARTCIIEKNNISLPDKFLRKWLIFINKEEFTEERVNSEFDGFIKKLKWQIISNKISSDNNIHVEQADIHNQAITLAQESFYQPGIIDFSDEEIERYTQYFLHDEKQIREITEKAQDDKVFEFIKKKEKIDEKLMSIGDFLKL